MDSIKLINLTYKVFKNFSISLPKKEILALTGVSGTGKSTLFKEVLLNECKKRFFTSLPLYIRQKLDLIYQDSDFDISGAMAPVYFDATKSKIEDDNLLEFLDVSSWLLDLFLKNSQNFCPIHLKEMRDLTFEFWTEKSLSLFENKFVVLTLPPLSLKEFSSCKEFYLKKGVLKCLLGTKVVDITSINEEESELSLSFVIDILKVNESTQTRLNQSLAGAMERFSKDQLYLYEINKTYEVSLETCLNIVLGYQCPEASCKYEPDISSNTETLELQSNYESKRAWGRSLAELESLTLRQLSNLSPMLEKHLSSSDLFEKVNFIRATGLDEVPLNLPFSKLSKSSKAKLAIFRLFEFPVANALYLIEGLTKVFSPDTIEKLWPYFIKLQSHGNTVLFLDSGALLLSKVDGILELEKSSHGSFTSGVLYFSPNRLKPYENLSQIAHSLLVQKESGDAHKVRSIESVEFSFAKLTEACLSFELKTDAFGCYCVSSTEALDINDSLKKINLEKKNTFNIKDHTIEEKKYKFFTGYKSSTATSIVVARLKVFTFIRELFAKTKDAQLLGVTASDMSLSRKGLRCESCLGTGVTKLAYPGFSDYLEVCEDCEGKRYGSKIYRLKYKNLTLTDILSLTVLKALEVFSNFPKISKKLKLAIDFGLGDIKLGEQTLRLSSTEVLRLDLIHFFEGFDNEATSYHYFLPSILDSLHPIDQIGLSKQVEQVARHGNKVFVASNYPSNLAFDEYTHIKLI